MIYRFDLAGEPTSQPTVYKLIFGSKFYIWKCKNIFASIEQMKDDINRFLRKGVKDDHLLSGVIKHITRSRVQYSTVEVLLQTDNLSELIDFEGNALFKCKENVDCLNHVYEPYLPKWIKENMNIDQPSVEEVQPIIEEKKSSKKTIKNKPVEAVISEVSPVHIGNVDMPAAGLESAADKAKRTSDMLKRFRESKSQK